MNLVWFLIGVVGLMGALWAINGALTGPSRMIDKDADGEPDEPDGPASGL